MNIQINQGTVLLMMTTEELGIIRYTLNEGTEKLESTARYLKSMNDPTYETANQTAQTARTANNDLETANQDWARAAK